MSIQLDTPSIKSCSSVSVSSEVYSVGSKLPFNVKNIIGLYLDKPTRDLVEKQANFTFIPSSVNLSDPKILKTYLASGNYLKFASPVLERIYETPPRSISTTNYGMAFTAEPEILAYLMKISKDKTVLEIAGASGENSLLLALSGAKKVFMNDIDPSEIATFRSSTSRMPKEIQERLACLEGDAFTQLKAIKSKVDVILCRNFIHFLRDDQQKELFSLLKEKLVDGGKVVFITNSIYAIPSVPQIVQKNPKCSSFKNIQCLVTDRLISTMPCMILFQQIEHCSSELQGTNYTAEYLYERAYGGKWIADQQIYKSLEPNLAKKIRIRIKQENDTIKKIKSGSVRLLTSYMRMYSEESLASVLEQHGFTVDQSFIVKRDGHLLESEKSATEMGQQVGVIATLNS